MLIVSGRYTRIGRRIGIRLESLPSPAAANATFEISAAFDAAGKVLSGWERKWRCVRLDSWLTDSNDRCICFVCFRDTGLVKSSRFLSGRSQEDFEVVHQASYKILKLWKT